MKTKPALALSLAAVSLMGALSACGETAAAPQSAPPSAAQPAAQVLSAAPPAQAKTPKYVFLFIGDGMSYPQFQAASDYLGAVADTNGDGKLDGNVPLNFMAFPVAGSAVTYDSTSFCPDSASTATSISTGHKTYSGTINMDETATVAYESIAEQLKAQLGWKIGVVSSVNLNHATPAAFYAHQASRGNYYEIGQELVASGFDYFAGGGLLKPTGADKDKTSLYDLAAQAGYDVVMTQAEAEQVTAGPVLIIDQHLADSDALSYENDRADGAWALSDYVEKGIQVLDNEKGFFLMVEGGKIDWACHANDAGSTIADTIALADAVDEAIAFAKSHPDETLILVTGDHETGGLTIGYAGTDYDTFLTNLTNQKISYAKFDSDYVAKYKEQGTSFEDVMTDVTALFGLKAQGAEDDKLVLTDYELDRLKSAYEATMDPDRAAADPASQAEYVLYGTYEPLSVTITHLLNNKSGIDFASYAHTGLPVAVFAQGAGEELFGGFYDNTQIYHKLADLLGVR